ncbi:MAG TPA: hypothetical protein DCK98_02865 [Chloroflexi bacterium]|jgi:hypothetical protein|nr:hypothetical protein [Chloroflexota bacterium]HAL28020.1 hypothetical protein [Chloroflexota bacterium]
MPGWIRFVIAFVVLCHGMAYLPYGLAPGQVVTEWKGVSQLFGGALTFDRTHVAVQVSFGSAVVALLACALAIALAPLVPGWWRPLAVVGSVAGLAGFALFWDGQGQLLVQEGVIGVARSLTLLIVAIAFPSVVR